MRGDLLNRDSKYIAAHMEEFKKQFINNDVRFHTERGSVNVKYI